jgi:hypothetical protein
MLKRVQHDKKKYVIPNLFRNLELGNDNELIAFVLENKNHPLSIKDDFCRPLSHDFSYSSCSLPSAARNLMTAGDTHTPFLLLLNETKAPALWTALTFWILDISMAITARAENHPIFFRVENLLGHFSPPDGLSNPGAVRLQLPFFRGTPAFDVFQCHLHVASRNPFLPLVKICSHENRKDGEYRARI